VRPASRSAESTNHLQFGCKRQRRPEETKDLPVRRVRTRVGDAGARTSENVPDEPAFVLLSTAERSASSSLEAASPPDIDKPVVEVKLEPINGEEKEFPDLEGGAKAPLSRSESPIPFRDDDDDSDESSDEDDTLHFNRWSSVGRGSV
jgi:hypothetical protein